MTKEEAIRRIKSWNLDSDDMEVLSVVIPELHESEDEKFQKYILKVCKECVEANDKGLELSMSTTKKLLSYLEKQKEQKQWSEEDERMLSRCIKSVECSKQFADSESYKAAKDVEMNWLKSLPERLVLQPKQEWSKKDEDFINMLILHFNYLVNKGGDSVETYKSYIEGLKSLPPKPHTVSIKNANKFAELEYERGVKDGIQSEKKRHWKPSEKQLIALRYYLNHVPYSPHKEHLSSLRDDCEKLFIQ